MMKSSEKIIAVYRYIDNEMHQLGVQLSPIKAMKLPYIAFGFYGAMNNQKHLFEDRIEAWKFGPTIPNLYKDIKANNPEITTTRIATLDEAEKECIDLVIKLYGKQKSFDLVDLTHQAGTPWSQVYEVGVDNEIPKDSIIKYYSSIVKSAKLANKFSHIFEKLAKQ